MRVAIGRILVEGESDSNLTVQLAGDSLMIQRADRCDLLTALEKHRTGRIEVGSVFVEECAGGWLRTGTVHRGAPSLHMRPGDRSDLMAALQQWLDLQGIPVD